MQSTQKHLPATVRSARLSLFVPYFSLLRAADLHRQVLTIYNIFTPLSRYGHLAFVLNVRFKATTFVANGMQSPPSPHHSMHIIHTRNPSAVCLCHELNEGHSRNAAFLVHVPHIAKDIETGQGHTRITTTIGPVCVNFRYRQRNLFATAKTNANRKPVNNGLRFFISMVAQFT
jgi:hypothetical protein